MTLDPRPERPTFRPHERSRAGRTSLDVDGDEVLHPWRLRLGDEAFALDLMRTVRTERLLPRVDRAPAAVVERARHAIRHIT